MCTSYHSLTHRHFSSQDTSDSKCPLERLRDAHTPPSARPTARRHMQTNRRNKRTLVLFARICAFFQYPPLLTRRIFALPTAKGLLAVTTLSDSPADCSTCRDISNYGRPGETNLSIGAYIAEKQGRKPTCFSARRHSVRIRVALDLSSTFPRLTFHFFSTLVLSGHLVVIKRPHVRPRFFTSGANLCPPPSTTYPRRLTHLETTGPSRYFVKGRPPRFPHQGSSRFQYARIASHPGTTDYVRPRAAPFPGHGGERYPLAKGRVQTMPLPPPHKKHPPH